MPGIMTPSSIIIETSEQSAMRLKRRSFLLTKITFNLSRGYYNFVYQMIKDKCANVNEQPLASNWLQLETSQHNKEFLEGKTPLMICAFIKENDVRISMARMLIENSARIDMINIKNGCNALHYACALLRFDLIDYYLNSTDFDLSLTDFNGNTALFYLISALHMIKLSDEEYTRGLKLVDLYLQLSKRFSFKINSENKFGFTLTKLCKLLGNKEIYQMLRNAITSTLPNAKTMHELEELRKEEMLFDNIETISVKNSVISNSRPSTNCSFLDEIVNFKKWSRPLIKSNKEHTRDTQRIAKLRTHSSTPIVRINRSSSTSNCDDPQQQQQQEQKIGGSALSVQIFRGNDALLKKYLLIDFHEIKYKQVEYSQEADEKLVRIYMNRLLGDDDALNDIYCTKHKTKDVVIIKTEPKQQLQQSSLNKFVQSTNSLNVNTSNEIKIYRSRSAVQIATLEEKNNNSSSRGGEVKEDSSSKQLEIIRSRSAQIINSSNNNSSRVPLRPMTAKPKLIQARLESPKENGGKKTANKVKAMQTNKHEDGHDWKDEMYEFYDKMQIMCSKSYRKTIKPNYEPINFHTHTKDEINSNSSTQQRRSPSIGSGGSRLSVNQINMMNHNTHNLTNSHSTHHTHTHTQTQSTSSHTLHVVQSAAVSNRESTLGYNPTHNHNHNQSHKPHLANKL